MSKNGNCAAPVSVERQFKEMSEKGTLETILVSDSRGFCWNAAGNHFDSGMLAALPSVLEDAIRTRRLRLRYFSGNKAGFDVDGGDLPALLQEAGLSAGSMAVSTEGFPMWLMSVTKTGQEDSLEFSLSASQGRVVIRPLKSAGCDLFLVAAFSNQAREKGASAPDVASLGNDVERVLKLLGGSRDGEGDSPKAERVSAILSDLRDANSDIRVAALHMDDGLVVASVFDSGRESDSMAAIASGIVHSCRLIGTGVLGGSPEQICFRGENGILIGTAVREDLLLTVLLEPGASIGVIESLVRHAVDRLAHVVAPQCSRNPQEV